MTLSVRKAFVHDYPTSLASLFIVGVWLVTLLADGPRTLTRDSGLASLLAVWTGIWLALIGWRLQRLFRLFKIGRVAPARVTVVWSPRWPGRGPFSYNFAFNHEGRSVRATMHVFRMRVVPSLKRGEAVRALYDPTQPTRAIILELFEAAS